MPAVSRNPALGLTAGNVPIAAAGARLADSGLTAAVIATALGNLGNAASANSLQTRQGIFLDGSSAISLNVGAFGTADFTIGGLIKSTLSGGVNRYILLRTAGLGIGIECLTNGAKAFFEGSVYAYGPTPATADNWCHVTSRRIGGIVTTFINAVAGTPVADASSYSAGINQSPATEKSLTGLYALNLGLTNAEILAHFQTGHFPSQYFPAQVAGTALITGTDSTFSGSGNWTGINGGTFTVTAGKGVLSTLTGYYAAGSIAGKLVAGTRYRFEATGSSFVGGTTVSLGDGAGTLYGTISAGANSIEFVSTYTGSLIVARGGDTTTGASLDDVSLIPLGVTFYPDFKSYSGGPQIADASNCGTPIQLPGDGVTGGVVPLIPGATPSPMTYTRTSSGYLIADQLVIPPNCSVSIWAKGNGTFSLGDSAGTPASVVNAQTAPTNLQPITQAGYVTANRKLYLTLGTATSVTVRVEYKSTP